jgi:hypothetical protein
MAFADGELGAEEQAAISRRAMADPAVAARLAVFRESRMLARQAFDDLLREPAPERLVAAALARRQILRRARSANSRFQWWMQMTAPLPLAASIALIACLGGVIGGWILRGPSTSTPLSTPAALAAAIAGTPSGGTIALDDGAGRTTVTAVASYRVAGGICRVFAAEKANGGALRALGCFHGDRWQVPVAVAEDATDRYRPASGAATSSIDAYLDAIDARDALGADEERRLIDSGWKF